MTVMIKKKTFTFTKENIKSLNFKKDNESFRRSNVLETIKVI